MKVQDKQELRNALLQRSIGCKATGRLPTGSMFQNVGTELWPCEYPYRPIYGKEISQRFVVFCGLGLAVSFKRGERRACIAWQHGADAPRGGVPDSEPRQLPLPVQSGLKGKLLNESRIVTRCPFGRPRAAVLPWALTRLDRDVYVLQVRSV